MKIIIKNKVEGEMKKKSLFYCILFSCIALVLTACGSASKLKGNFEKEEYVVSYGETIDFYQNFSANESLSFVLIP